MFSDARRICYALVDVTANGLKSALRTRESEYMYEKIKSKYNHSRHDPSLLMQKRIAQEIQADEDHERVQRNYKKSTSFTDGDGILELVDNVITINDYLLPKKQSLKIQYFINPL